MAPKKQPKSPVELDLDILRKKMKDDIIDLDQQHDYFLTGNPMFDAFVGSGGLPKYQMQYIWGTNSIGKSTLAIQILAAYQRQFGHNTIVVYFDREESLTKARLQNLGVDISKVAIMIPAHIEYITEKVVEIRAIYEQMGYDIFAIWDTIAMTPAKEDTEGYERIGSQARALANMFKKISFYDLKLTMFNLNQHRETISANAYAPKEPPGGNATKHKSFLTLNGTSKKSDVWPDGYNVGKCTTLSTVKSKIISPHRRMVFEYTFVHGYDAILTAIRYMWKEAKLLKKSAGRWQFEGDETKYLLKELYKWMMTDESVPKWKACIEAMYDDFYGYDDEVFIAQAKERIYNYYFPKDKIDLDSFTSINVAVVEPRKEVIEEPENMASIEDIAATLEGK